MQFELIVAVCFKCARLNHNKGEYNQESVKWIQLSLEALEIASRRFKSKSFEALEKVALVNLVEAHLTNVNPSDAMAVLEVLEMVGLNLLKKHNEIACIPFLRCQTISMYNTTTEKEYSTGTSYLI